MESDQLFEVVNKIPLTSFAPNQKFFQLFNLRPKFFSWKKENPWLYCINMSHFFFEKFHHFLPLNNSLIRFHIFKNVRLYFSKYCYHIINPIEDVLSEIVTHSLFTTLPDCRIWSITSRAVPTKILGIQELPWSKAMWIN